MQQYFPLILLAVAAVVLFVLPARQRKRQMAQQQQMRESLVPGTRVMTTSGLHGTVAGKGEGTVDLEIAPGVVVTFAQQAVLEVRQPAGGVAPVDPELPGDDERPSDGTR
jgi:preprotein translocase subunit YajC